MDRIAAAGDGGETHRRGREEEAELHTDLVPSTSLGREMNRARQGREGASTKGEPQTGEPHVFDHFIDPRGLISGETGASTAGRNGKDLAAGIGMASEGTQTKDGGANAGANGAAAGHAPPDRTDLLQRPVKFDELSQQGSSVHPSYSSATSSEPSRTTPRGERGSERMLGEDGVPRALASATALASALRSSVHEGVTTAFAKLMQLFAKPEGPHSGQHADHADAHGPVANKRASLGEPRTKGELPEKPGPATHKASPMAAFSRPGEPGATAETAREEAKRSEVQEDKAANAAEASAVKKPKDVKEGRDAKDQLERLLQSEGFEEAQVVDTRDLWHADQGADEAKNPQGLRAEDALGRQFRCHGTLEDGSRCLRRPTAGTSFCLEHLGRIAHQAVEGLEQLDTAEGVDQVGGGDEVTSPSTRALSTEEVTSPGVPVAGSVITD